MTVSAVEIFSVADNKLEIDFVINLVFLDLRKFVTRKDNFKNLTRLLKGKLLPEVGFEPTRKTRPLALKTNALTTRPSWYVMSACRKTKEISNADLLYIVPILSEGSV